MIPAESLPKTPEDVEHGVDRAAAATTTDHEPSVGAPAPAPAPAERPVAAMRNLYTAALSYDGYTITDGALRLIVLLHAADLGYVYHTAAAAVSSQSGTYIDHTSTAV